MRVSGQNPMNGKPKFSQLSIPSVLLMSAFIIFVDTCYITSSHGCLPPV